MSIKVIHNKKLDLKIPEFSCDGSLNENLEKYPMLQNLKSTQLYLIGFAKCKVIHCTLVF